jgi:hypothetical protein
MRPCRALRALGRPAAGPGTVADVRDVAITGDRQLGQRVLQSMGPMP